MKRSQYYTLLDTIKLTLDGVPMLTDESNIDSSDIRRVANELTLSALNKLNVLLDLAYTNELGETKRGNYDEED